MVKCYTKLQTQTKKRYIQAVEHLLISILPITKPGQSWKNIYIELCSNAPFLILKRI